MPRAIATRPSRIAVIVVGLFAAVAIAAAPARAYKETEYRWGSTGADLSLQDTVDCRPYTISHPGPLVGRATSYTNYVQYIQMWPRIDVWNGTRWAFYRWGLGQARTVYPNYNAKFSGYTGDPSFANLSPGLYRVGYFFRWSVNGATIGEALTWHAKDDYYGPGWDIAWCNLAR